MNPKVNNKTSLLELLKSNSAHILSFGVKRLGLFGSFQRDTEISKDSDIDLLIDFEEEKETFRNFIDLIYFLEEKTGRKVEVLTRIGLSKHIGPYILKELEDVPLQKRRGITKTHSGRA